MSTQNYTERDGSAQSAWQNAKAPAANTLNADNDVYNCLIVGGGITGLTAALLLQQNGQKTVVAEAHTIGFGTTGGTSAHINTFADTTYPEAESAFGEEGAQLFADAINAGFAVIKNNVAKYGIDCDFDTRDGYLYAESEDEVKQLDEIYQGAVKVRVAVDYTDNVPTPVPYKKALRFPGQAQFHPVKYLNALQEAYVQAGGVICEHTLIDSLSKEGGVHIAASDAGKIRANKVIYATHMPPNINVFNFECAPYRSYVIAVKLISGDYPQALIYDTQEPYHYVRTHTVDGEKLLLVGGNDHKTGHDDPEQAFASLESYTRKYYDVESVAYKWSSQYYVPADGLPYVGELPMASAGIYCATGYNGNGMMLGSVSGAILADLVLGKENQFADLFDTSRFKPIDSFSEFVKENADVAYRFVTDRFGKDKIDSLNSLAPGTGKVVNVDGDKIAAYRDESGKIYALSPICTHTGCIVNWNAAETTWDCPCHGARYDVEGNVLTGPATKNLHKIESE